MSPSSGQSMTDPCGSFERPGHPQSPYWPLSQHLPLGSMLELQAPKMLPHASGPIGICSTVIPAWDAEPELAQRDQSGVVPLGTVTRHRNGKRCLQPEHHHDYERYCDLEHYGDHDLCWDSGRW